MSRSRRPVLVDTDMGSDDAVALIMALRSPAVEVKAITVVAGNVPVEQGCRNALYTVELCAAEVPVYAGAGAPLVRALQIADWFHGRDGLGDHGYAPVTRTIEAEGAVDAIVRTVSEHPGIEIVTLGPLTNVALAVTRHPGLVENVGRCVVMGGAPCCEGNVTPAAEYNMWVDPEAARTVVHSGLPIELIGWQLCRGAAVISREEMERLEVLQTPFADFAIRSNSTAIEAYRIQTGEIGLSLPDPVAMSVLLNSSLCLHGSRHYVEVETLSQLTRGMTIVDRLNVCRNSRNQDVWSEAIQRNAQTGICWQLDIPGWKGLLFRLLS